MARLQGRKFMIFVFSSARLGLANLGPAPVDGSSMKTTAYFSGHIIEVTIEWSGSKVCKPIANIKSSILIYNLAAVPNR